MDHAKHVTDYLSAKSTDSTIFTVRCIHIAPRGHIITDETSKNRRGLGHWLGVQLRQGAFEIGNYEISVYSTGTPHSYLARRLS